MRSGLPLIMRDVLRRSHEGPVGSRRFVSDESPAGSCVRAADLVSRSVMFPEPDRVSELVAALRPAVPSPSSRPDDGSNAATAGGSTEATQGSAAAEESTAEANREQQEHQIKDAAAAHEQAEEAPRSAAAVTSSSLAESIVRSGVLWPRFPLCIRHPVPCCVACSAVILQLLDAQGHTSKHAFSMSPSGSNVPSPFGRTPLAHPRSRGLEAGR